MPYTFKITWFFAGYEQGWTESFALQRDSSNIRQVGDQIADAYQKRSRLLANGYFQVAQRIALVLDPAGQPIRRVTDLAEPRLPGVAAWKPSTPNLCLLCEWQNGGADRFKAQYMRGIPSGLGELGKKPNEDYASWKTSFDAWTAAMVSIGAGWLGTITDTQYTLTNWVSNVNTGITTFTVKAGDPDFPTSFGFPFRASIRIPGSSPLDGTHVLVPNGTLTCYTAKPLPAAPHVVDQVGTMTYRSPVFYTLRPTDQSQPPGLIAGKRITTRDTGRPTIAGRGRRAAIVRF